MLCEKEVVDWKNEQEKNCWWKWNKAKSGAGGGGDVWMEEADVILHTGVFFSTYFVVVTSCGL